MRPKPFALVLALLGTASAGFAQRVAPDYAIGTWQGFATAAASYTFDDNTPKQLAVAVPLFDTFGYKLTLFAIANAGGTWPHANWAGMAAAAANGHEIASHTVTHPKLAQVSLEQQTAELVGARDSIHAFIPGSDALTFAYPYCVRSDAALTASLYYAARGCSGRIEPPTPDDLLDVSALIVGTQSDIRTAADLNARVDSAVARGGWITFVLHGIDDDGGWSPVASEELRQHLTYLDARRADVWVATFSEAARYVRERDAATVTEVSATDDLLVVQVTDTLDDATYDVPITLRRVLPTGWAATTVTQNGHAVPHQLIAVNGTRYVQFDVVPDAGAVHLTRRHSLGATPGSTSNE